ncbi:MAG: TolC family protein [Alistipes sp.]
MKKSLLTLLLLFCVATIQAQTDAPAEVAQRPGTFTPGQPNTHQIDLMDMTVDNYINLQLPPLHLLLESARENASQVNMFAAKKAYEERELKTLRRSWLSHIRINSAISYGTNDMSNQISYANNQNPIIQNVTGTTQRWWNVGASLALPLDEIFNRNNKLKQQRQRIASIQYEVDGWYDEICLKIIDSYTTAVQYLSILETTARTMITAKAQYTAAESDFINGKIDMQTLSREKAIENDTIRQYEQARAELNKALLQLEVLSKTPIISKWTQTKSSDSK